MIKAHEKVAELTGLLLAADKTLEAMKEQVKEAEREKDEVPLLIRLPRLRDICFFGKEVRGTNGVCVVLCYFILKVRHSMPILPHAHTFAGKNEQEQHCAYLHFPNSPQLHDRMVAARVTEQKANTIVDANTKRSNDLARDLETEKKRRQDERVKLEQMVEQAKEDHRVEVCIIYEIESASSSTTSRSRCEECNSL